MATKITTRVRHERRKSALFIRLSGELSSRRRINFGRGVVGQSSQIETIHRLIKKYAALPGLITGETGTGEGTGGPRHSDKAAAAVNIHRCGKLFGYSGTLFESELFGYERGSFTGAKKGGKIIKIEMAQRPCFWTKIGGCRCLPSPSSCGFSGVIIGTGRF